MYSLLFSRVTRAVIAALVLVAVSAQVAAARPQPGARRTRGFNLFAETFTLFLVNRVACGVNNLGEICVDPGNSPIGGGGFWPRGTPDQYIFNSGLQLAGIIPVSEGFEWAGDTVGAYFMDARGTQQQGEGISLVYNSLDPDDAANWPAGAVVRDTAIYAPVLIGRNVISQQDLWSRSWDGNPNLLSGRTHPMGVLVETRGLAWNFPTGNEDILYFVFNFYNITASDPAVYANLDPAIQSEIVAIGERYQDQVKNTLKVDLPDGGYTIEETYAAFTMDPDVGDAAHNYSTGVLPFSIAIAYKADFLEAGWTFPADIFGPPFAAAPGFVGVKYLKSPADPITGVEFGLTMFSNTRNAATAFPDPVGVVQLWRYLSGKVDPAAGDNPCSGGGTQADWVARRWCFQDTQDVDTRFYLSSGPFTLEPGQVFTIVVAYVHAAALAQYITVGTLNPAPGNPPSAAGLAAGTDTARRIDRAAGWVSHADGGGETSADGIITQDEVVTVPRSILNKSLVAQAVFDARFLLPSAPASPTFFLVPGDNQVSIVWQPSPTETLGDPYFQVAGDPASALFNPNFREIDVEGYRIYRGRTPGNMKLIAQFDYDGTFFRDRTGAIDYGDCAPELGIYDECPETFDYPVTNTGPYNDVDISGDLIQIATGGRAELASGAVQVLPGKADTAVTGSTATAPGQPLTNSGVPFAFVDDGVVNSLTYFYAVTAFDVNSVQSGPTSLESAAIAKSVTPRAPAGNAKAAVLSTSVQGDDGVALDTDADWPTIDPDNGTFSGNIPPLADGTFGFLASVSEALPPGDIFLRIDSVGAGFQGGFGPQPTVYVTMEAGGNVVTASTSANQTAFNSGAAGEYALSTPLVPYDSTLSDLVGLDFTDSTVRMPVEFEGTSTPFAYTSPGVGVAVGRYGVSGWSTAARYLAHSRWFDEGGSEPADPTITDRADSSHNAGALSGVSRIWAPSSYRSALSFVSAFFRGRDAAGSTVWYPADFVVTWGAGGAVTVRDVSNNVNLPYNGGTYASGYGFLNLSDVIASGMDQAGFDFEFALTGSGVYDIINYQHFIAVDPTCTEYWGVVSFDCIELSETAELTPLDFNNDGVKDGDGVVLVINGEPFMMQTNTLPASGTAWHLRAVSGKMSATCLPGPAVQPTNTDCSEYEFEPNSTRPTNVPGIKYVIRVESQYAVNAADTADLSKVHTVPDPYYVTNAMELTTTRKVLKFVNLPSQAIIRIYTVSGVLVAVVEHNNPAGGGEVVWDLRNRNNQFVASGVYFYHIETPTGQTRVGRFTVVNYAQ